MCFRYLFILLLFLLFFSCGKTPSTLDIPWEELPSPANSSLNDLLFINEEEGFVTGGELFDHGLVAQTTDGGISWVVDSLDAQIMNALIVANDQLFAAGGGGQVFTKKLDVNQNWERIPLATNAIFNAVATNQSEVWLCSGVAFQAGAIFQLDTSRQLSTLDSFDQELSAVEYSSANDLFAVGYGLILRSVDGGSKWRQIPIWGDFYRDIHFPTALVGYIVSQNGSILKTVDGGENWVLIRDASKAKLAKVPLRAVHFTDQDTGCVVGENGTIWITLNGGDSWNQFASFPDVDLFGVQILNNIGFAVGEQGRIFRFELP